MFKKLRIFFEHNCAERNGTIALLIIIFCGLLITWFATEFYEPPKEDISELAAYIEQQNSKGDNHSHLQDTILLKPFQFDPNTLSDSGYLQLGFSGKEIKTLRNYQKAGGSFRKKSDFKRLFFVDSAEYAQLEPFILLPESNSKVRRSKRIKKPTKTAWSDTATYVPYTRDSLIELNTADTHALKSLKGIGSFYANEIVRYRSELGGYHNLGQLLELWKMESSKIDVFADRVIIDSNFIRTIQINKLTSQELSAHPYISLQLASKLIYSRESAGRFKNLQDLHKRKLVNEELSSKLAPYLDFE